jgi:hypothetical protein
LTEQAPTLIDDLQIRAWIKGKIEAADPSFPRPAPSTVYVVAYPETTVVTLQGATSCLQFAGYHAGGQLSDGTLFSYAVLPRCPRDAGSPLDDLTIVASHELIEACTDPQPEAAPAYQVADPDHPGMTFFVGSEVGDMCELANDAFDYQPAGLAWAVQRSWSNQSAAMGNNPCLPAATNNYYYAAPMVADTMTTSVLTGSPLSVAVVHVPVGSSASVGVKLFSNYASGPLVLGALDGASFLGRQAQLNLSFDVGTANPGDTVHLTIQKLSGSPGSGAEPFAVFTHPQSAPANSYTVFWAVTSD